MMLDMEHGGFDPEFDDNENIPTISQLINNQDYTLNSPLIVDEIEAFIKFLKTGVDNQLDHTINWDRRMAWLNNGIS